MNFPSANGIALFVTLAMPVVFKSGGFPDRREVASCSIPGGEGNEAFRHVFVGRGVKGIAQPRFWRSSRGEPKGQGYPFSVHRMRLPGLGQLQGPPRESI